MLMMIEALGKVIKRKHYPLEVMLTCVRWYAAYPLSLRHIEEMMQERGKKANSISDDELWSSSPCSTAIVRM